MAEKKLSLDLEINKGTADKSVKSIKTELREAKEEAIALARKFGELSPQAVQAASKLAALKDEMGDLNQAVQGLNPDKFQRMATLTNGVVRGFQAAQGAMVLFGKSGEDVEKAILKLQGVMALADGIQGVIEARKQFVALGQQIIGPVIGAFKKMGTAMRGMMAASGIGLIVVALGAIVAYWDDIKEAVTGVNGETQKQGKLLDKEIEQTNDLLETHKASHETQKLRGKTEKEILQTEIEITDRLIKQQKAKLENLRIAQAEAVASRQKLYDTWGGRVKMFGFDTPATIKKEGDELIKAQEKVLLALTESRAKADNQITAIDTAAYEKAKAIGDKAKADADAAAKKDLEDKKKRSDEILDERKKLHLLLLGLENDYNIKVKESEDREKQRVAKEKEDFDQMALKQVATNNAQLDAINEARRLKLIEDEKNYQLKIQQLKESAITAGFDLLNALNQAGENASEQQRKKSFERNKALAIAETTISTFMAAQRVFSNAAANPKSILFPAQPYIEAGIAIASGLAKVINIKKQSYSGGATGGTSGGNQQGGGGGFQAASTGFTQIAKPQTNITKTDKQDTKPIKVYVVQKDLDQAKERSDAIKAKALVK